MARALLWRQRAEEDVAEHYLFIGADAPASAERFLDAIAEDLTLLGEHPGLGAAVELPRLQGRELRSWSLRGFSAYVVYYRVNADSLEVVRLLHGSRDVPRILRDDL